MATTTKPRTRTKKAPDKTEAADAPKVQDAAWKVKRVNLKQINTSYNHRNPLSTHFQQEGYGVFPDDVPPGSDKPPLWSLATSDDPLKRHEFCELMDKYDGEEKDGGGIIGLAWNIVSVGLINPINVRDNGNGQFQLVAGHRRSLAQLYLWCKGISRAKVPMLDAQLESGNTNQLQARAVSENRFRKPITLIEQAKSMKMAMNSGESADEIAAREHCSVQTVQQRVSLLDLPHEDQKKVEDGRLKYTDAIEIVRDLKAGGTGKTKGGKSASEAADAHTAKGGSRNRMASRKQVEEWWAGETNADARAAYARVLKMDAESNGAAPVGRGTVNIPDNIVPGEIGKMEEGEAEEIKLDGKGRPVVSKK